MVILIITLSFNFYHSIYITIRFSFLLVDYWLNDQPTYFYISTELPIHPPIYLNIHL